MKQLDRLKHLNNGCQIYRKDKLHQQHPASACLYWINKKNDFNVIHTHPNCYLSAAYYVKAPKDCGRFQIECPNIARRYAYPEVEKKNELNTEVAGIDVKEGDLLIFPGYLPHKVAKNESDEDRIVISFNVDVK